MFFFSFKYREEIANTVQDQTLDPEELMPIKKLFMKEIRGLENKGPDKSVVVWRERYNAFENAKKQKSAMYSVSTVIFDT